MARGRAMRAMAVKEVAQLRRDRRTVALLIFQPLLLLIVFGYAASFDVSEVPAALLGSRAEQAASQVPDVLDVAVIEPSAGRERAQDLLRAGDVTVAVLTDQQPPQVLVDGSQLFAARGVVTGLAQSGAPVDVEVLYNPDLQTPPVLVPALAGLVLAFVGTIATSLGVVRERQAGTIEQLAVMPFRPADVLVGKVAPYLVVSLIDLGLVMTAAVTIFDVPFVGSVWPFVTGACLFLLVVLGLGLLVSSVSENQGQAMQLAIMVTVPQVLLSGIIFPLESMARALQFVAYALPLTWFVEVARGVMLRGAGFSDLVVPLVALAGIGAIVFVVSVIRVRRDLLPQGRSRRRHDEPARSEPVGVAR